MSDRSESTTGLLGLLMSRPIMFHPQFMAMTHDPGAAILLSKVVRDQRRAGLGAWWYATDEELIQTTGLSSQQIVAARECLIQLGLLKFEPNVLADSSSYLLHDDEFFAGLAAATPKYLEAMRT